MSQTERHAWNEAVISKLNSDLAEYDQASGFGDAVLDFVCECFRAGCRVRLPMTAREWTAIHEQPDQYVVAPEHEDAPEREIVVARTAGHWTVRKIGRTAAAARAAEHRLDGPGGSD